MTDLKCSVTSCVSNESSLCTLHAIQVGGSNATTKQETVCDSFRDRSSAPTNSVNSGDAKMETEIRCDATDCQYNHSRACNANYIYVQGSGTGSANNTRCDTFKAK